MNKKDVKQFFQKINITAVVIGVVSSAIVFSFGYGLGTGRLQFGNFNLSRQNAHLPTSLNYSEVDEVYLELRNNYDGELNHDELIEGLKKGLVGATGDPYTEYFDPQQARELDLDLAGSFTGIGAELGIDNGQIVIIAPLSGFPAESAGIRANDAIVEIDGESTQGMSVTEAVSVIRGPEGTDVELGIIRGNNRLDITITRAEITIASVEHEILEGNIGYLKVNRFASTDTMELTNQAVEEFERKQVRGIVLDLRNNPGGFLDVSEEFAGLWLPSGKEILEERRIDGGSQDKRSKGPGTFENTPTTVLINEGSASASEIVAGALRDHGLAQLIGVQTFGKGSVQSLIEFTNGSILKVTITHWYTPNGHGIDEEGLKPDKEVELTEEDFEAGRDPQLDAAIRQLRQ